MRKLDACNINYELGIILFTKDGNKDGTFLSSRYHKIMEYLMIRIVDSEPPSKKNEKPKY